MANGSRVRRVAVGLARRCLLGVVCVASLASSASAHQIYVIARVQDRTISGEAYFRGKAPARNVKVTAFDPAGEVLAETTTDEAGKFSFTAQHRCDHRILVDTGDGHGAECIVTAAELPTDLPSRGGTPAAGTRPPAAPGNERVATLAGDEQVSGVRADIAALRSEIIELRQQTRLRDVLGGIGYILGIAGVAFYFLGLKRQQSHGGN